LLKIHSKSKIPIPIYNAFILLSFIV
jgi:hypothetical protein